MTGFLLDSPYRCRDVASYVSTERERAVKLSKWPMFSNDPAAAHHYITFVKHRGLARGNRALRFIKTRQNFVIPRPLNRSGSRLMAVPDLYRDPHRLVQIRHRDQVRSMRPQAARVKILLITDHNLPSISLNLQNVQWRTGGHAQPLALANGEVMDATMFGDHLTVGRDQFARGVRQRVAPLGQVGLQELLVVATRDETNLLRVGLLRQGQAMLVGQLADLRLGHVAEGKQSAAELLLGEAEEKI